VAPEDVFRFAAAEGPNQAVEYSRSVRRGDWFDPVL
jgi:hypothetical protein